MLCLFLQLNEYKDILHTHVIMLKKNPTSDQQIVNDSPCKHSKQTLFKLQLKTVFSDSAGHKHRSK